MEKIHIIAINRETGSIQLISSMTKEQFDKVMIEQFDTDIINRELDLTDDTKIEEL